MMPAGGRRSGRIVGALAALALLWAPGARAHDIPDEVIIPVFVREIGGELQLVARMPLLLLAALNTPKWGAGFLDLERADPALRRAAEAFGAEAPLFRDDGSLIEPRVVAQRVALPWDRSFTSFEGALETVGSDPLPVDTQIFWNQGFLDIHLAYPAPEIGGVSMECGVAPGFGDRVALDVIYETQAEDGTWEGDLFHISVREGRVALDPTAFQAVRAFTRSGVEHILTGWDHLLFLLCLIAPFGSLPHLRRLLIIVTGFTVAHSVTLVSAALGYAPDPAWFPPLVESVVALSILYTAAENLISASVTRRTVLAFLFGLAHGFGFAFALGESLAFAGDHIPVALFSFNLGVELGQAAVVVAVLPLLHLLSRSDRARTAVNAVLSIFAGHAAWHLLGPRVEELSRAWILSGQPMPGWSWLIAPLAVAGAASWVVVLLRRRADDAAT